MHQLRRYTSSKLTRNPLEVYAATPKTTKHHYSGTLKGRQNPWNSPYREGQTINQKTVACYMQEMGLAAMYPSPNLSKRAQQAAIFPYLLAHVTANLPNHIVIFLLAAAIFLGDFFYQWRSLTLRAWRQRGLPSRRTKLVGVFLAKGYSIFVKAL